MAVAGGPGPGDDGERRDADRELVELLVSLPPDDERWVIFRAHYAQVLRRSLCCLLRHGHLGDLADPPALGRLSPRERAVLAAEPGELTSLADVATMDALRLFEKRQRQGHGWDPDQARSLDSYLINGGVYALSSVIRRWRRDRDAAARELATEPDELGRAVGDGTVTTWSSTPHDPVDIVVTTDEVRRMLDTMRSDDVLRRAALERMDTDDSWAAIAGRVGVSVKNLERRLARFRADWGKSS